MIEDGVREAWIVHVMLKDGRTIDVKIVHLTRRTAEIAIDTKVDPTVVEPIEICPP